MQEIIVQRTKQPNQSSRVAFAVMFLRCVSCVLLRHNDFRQDFMPTSGTIMKYFFLVISHISPVISKELDNMIEKRGKPEIKSVRGKLSPAHGQKAKISFFL